MVAGKAAFGMAVLVLCCILTEIQAAGMSHELNCTPLFVGIFTVLWYFTSSKNAIATQQLVQMNENVQEDGIESNDAGYDGIMASLTFLQLLVGLLTAKVASWLCAQMSTGVESAHKNASSTARIRMLIGTLHYVGSISTNLGFAYGNASIVQAIKLLEPIETLVLTVVVHRVLQARSEHVLHEVASGTKINMPKACSVVVIVSGTLLLLSSSSMQENMNIHSVVFALLSGIALSSRNVVQKTFRDEKTGCTTNMTTRASSKTSFSRMVQIAVDGLDNFICITSYSLAPAFFFLLVAEFKHHKPGSTISGSTVVYTLTKTKQFGMQAIAFHGLFNIFSICVLTLVSAPTHSLLNVGKRVSNVIVAAFYFHDHLGSKGMSGLAVAAIGGCCYSRSVVNKHNTAVDCSFMERRRSCCKIAVIGLALSLLTLACFSDECKHILWQNSRLKALSAEWIHDKQTDVKALSAEWISDQRRNVVLFGPHDRYNFGDLLFTKVLLRLLQTRAGYKENEILIGGIISTNMTKYGGEEHIVSMKTIQSMSRKDKIKGPYDIVFTGGESAGCTHDCAVGMLRGHGTKNRARSEKIYNCGYLIPKDLLALETENVTNRAVVNSIGNYLNAVPDCKRAIDVADCVAFRDRDPLYPDSAVMTRKLFQRKIDSVAKKVLHELFHNHKNGTQTKYIAVHHKVCDRLCCKKLASSLDVVSKKSGATIVFFAAGTAPGHDSFAMYKNVASFMKQPSVVYKAEHVWSVVAVISRAEAVLSTSLHVRIMAFIYWKPRITWCPPNEKHDSFISLCDRESTPCLQDISKTWSVLSGYLGADARSSNEVTKTYYYKAVDKYMDSFDKWSRLLRHRSD